MRLDIDHVFVVEVMSKPEENLGIGPRVAFDSREAAHEYMRCEFPDEDYSVERVPVLEDY